MGRLWGEAVGHEARGRTKRLSEGISKEVRQDGRGPTVALGDPVDSHTEADDSALQHWGVRGGTGPPGHLEGWGPNSQWGGGHGRLVGPPPRVATKGTAKATTIHAWLSVGPEGHGVVAKVNAWWSLGSVGPWKGGRGHAWGSVGPGGHGEVTKVHAWWSLGSDGPCRVEGVMREGL